MHVYIVSLYTTGERYQTIVCRNERAVDRVLVGKPGRRLTRKAYSNDGIEGYEDPIDKTQTAIVSRVPLVE
jgi:hypothetical protein